MTSTRSYRKTSPEARAQAAQTLRDWLGDKPVVWGHVEHVSQSGMTRHIALFAVVDGQIRHITYQAAQVLGESVRDYYYTPGIIQHGAGMDMVWNLIYNLSHALYGDHRIRDEKL